MALHGGCRRGIRVWGKALSGQQLAGELDEGVAAAAEVVVGQVDTIVGGDAELGGLAVNVVHRHGGEAHAPAAGQRAREGHAGAAARLVAHDLDAGQGLHVERELVGGGEDLAVSEHDDGLLPADVAGGLQIARLHRREVAVAAAGLVLPIAHEGFLVAEAGGQFLGVGQVAAAVAADVDDQAPTEDHVEQRLVEVAFADALRERFIAHVADVVVEDGVVEPGGNLVVRAHIAAQQRVADVGRIVLGPRPVAPEVVRGGEVDVTVAQLGKHVAEHLEQLLLRHALADLTGIAGVHLLPVEPVGMLLVVEEAVVLVDNLPQGLEVALRRVVVFIFVDARCGQAHQAHEREDAADDV